MNPWQRTGGVEGGNRGCSRGRTRSKERAVETAGTLGRTSAPPAPFYYPFPWLRKERIADARAAVKIFFENKDTVSG